MWGTHRAWLVTFGDPLFRTQAKPRQNAASESRSSKAHPFRLTSHELYIEWKSQSTATCAKEQIVDEIIYRKVNRLFDTPSTQGLLMNPFFWLSILCTYNGGPVLAAFTVCPLTRLFQGSGKSKEARKWMNMQKLIFSEGLGVL